MMSAAKTRNYVAVLASIHVALLTTVALSYSPCFDETGHLVSGIYHWTFGTFECYNVNPPLPRMLASIPIIASSGYEMDWWGASASNARTRIEFRYAQEFFRLNGRRCQRLLVLARIVTIPISVLGMILLGGMVRRLYGEEAMFVALGLWCFSPHTLAFGCLVTPDMPATSAGLLSIWCFWRWLQQPELHRATLAGICLGIAQLTKATWIILFVLYPAIWLLMRDQKTGFCRQLGQMLCVLAIGVTVLNAGYGFQGSGTSLGDFDFVSKSLRGEDSVNRFRGSWVGSVPIPLPTEYVRGVDFQKSEFEGAHPSYLLGQWQNEGWWWYYLYALLVKTPVATLALCAWGTATMLRRRPSRAELVTLIPLVAVLVFVSSQSGMNHHMRYVLPFVPAMFLLACRTLSREVQTGRRRKAVAWTLVVATAVSSLAQFPYSLSYFNLLAGGPKHGWRHLSNSNVDWGQGLIALARWEEMHPDRPLKVIHAVRPIYNASTVGCKAQDIREVGPFAPGWYAISASCLANEALSSFHDLGPVDFVANCIFIFHLEQEAPSG